MTLQEALRSGKRYRLPGGGWFGPDISYNYTKHEVLSNAWEVKQEPREFEVYLAGGGNLHQHPIGETCTVVDNEKIRVREILE